MATAEVLAHRITYHGEGAVWWPDDHLRLVDGYAGEVVDLMADGSVQRTQVGDYAACVRPRLDGGAVVGIERGIAVVDDDGTQHTGPELWSDPGVRMNEGNCDPDGNFWCGSMAGTGEAGAGTLFRFDAGGIASVQLGEVSVPNGLGWSPDGAVAYWNDTPTQTVWCFDYATDAGLLNRRPFAVLDSADGSPDGLTVDRAGGVWVACWGGSAVRHFDVRGQLDLVVAVGAKQVSSCAIGGPQLDRLFITTSREGLAAAADPLAGSVFTYDLGESLGTRVLTYAG